MRLTWQSISTAPSSLTACLLAVDAVLRGTRLAERGISAFMDGFLRGAVEAFKSKLGVTPDQRLGGDVQHEHQEHEDERRRPRELDEVRERAPGKVVDEHGERGDRRTELAVEPVVAEERREEQRRGFAHGARE